LLIYAGRVDEGLALVRDVLRREPGHPPCQLMVIVGEQMRGHPERPLSAFSQGPGPTPRPYWYLLHGLLNLAVGDHPRALAALASSNTEDSGLLGTLAQFLAGAIRGEQGTRELLTPEVEEGAWHDASYAEHVAEGFALLNDAEQAARWLGRAVDAGFSCHEGLARYNAVWRPWLDHPLLAPVFERMRIQAAQQAALPIGPRLRALMEAQ
jgi:hypothetical protein